MTDPQMTELPASVPVLPPWLARAMAPLPLAPLLVLSTYWAAQWFIVGSLRERATATSL